MIHESLTEQNMNLNPNSKEENKSKNLKKSNRFQSLLCIIKTLIGVGDLIIPYAFFKAGILVSSIFIGLSAFLSYKATMTLITIGEDSNNPRKDLGSVIKFNTKGNHWARSYNIFLIIYVIGITISYIIFISNVFQSSFSYFGIELNRIFYLLIALAIILPISLVIKNFHYYYIISGIGNFLFLIVYLSCFYLDFYTIAKNKALAPNLEYFINFSNIPYLLGASVFACLSYQNLMNIKNSCEDPKNFKSTYKLGITIACLFYIIFGICGAISFGSLIDPTFLFGLQVINKNFYFITLLYAIAIIFSTPLQLFEIFVRIEEFEIFTKFFKRNQGNYFLKNIHRFLLPILVIVLGYLLKSLGNAVSIVGSMVSIPLMFIIPYYVYENFYKPTTLWRKLFHGIIVVLGVIAGSVAVVYNIYSLAKNY